MKRLLWLAPAGVALVFFFNAGVIKSIANQVLFVGMEGETSLSKQCETGQDLPQAFNGKKSDPCLLEQKSGKIAVPFLIFPFTRYGGDESRSGSGFSGKKSLEFVARANTALDAEAFAPKGSESAEQIANLGRWQELLSRLERDRDHATWRKDYQDFCARDAKSLSKNDLKRGLDLPDGNDCKSKDKFQINVATPCGTSNPESVGNIKGMYQFKQGSTRYLGFALKLDRDYEAPAGAFFIHLQLLHVNKSYCGDSDFKGDSGHPPLTLGIRTLDEKDAAPGSPARLSKDLEFYLESQHIEAKVDEPVPPFNLYREKLSREKWYHFKFELTPVAGVERVDKLGVYSGYGTIKLWVNDIKVMDYSGPWTYPTDEHRSENFILGLGFYRSRQLQTQRFYLDDIVFSDKSEHASMSKDADAATLDRKVASSWERRRCGFQHANAWAASGAPKKVPFLKCDSAAGSYLSIFPGDDKAKLEVIRVPESTRAGRVRPPAELSSCEDTKGKAPCRVACQPLTADEKVREKNQKFVCKDATAAREAFFYDVLIK